MEVIAVFSQAALGGAGAIGGSEPQRRKEADCANTSEQEVQAQESLEADIKNLEEKRIRDEIARKATTADVSHEQEASRVEAQLTVTRKILRRISSRARRILIPRDLQELAELERQENGG